MNIKKLLVASWLGKEMISLSPPPRRTGHTSHLAPGSSHRRTPRGIVIYGPSRDV
jgi:hypothetical protein